MAICGLTMFMSANRNVRAGTIIVAPERRFRGLNIEFLQGIKEEA